jgi:hypothetical protein
MTERGQRSSRDHHALAGSTASLHAVAVRHGDDYKSLFQAYICSDIFFRSKSVSDIILSIKDFALIQSIDTDPFALDMTIKSITSLLFLAASVEASRVTKLSEGFWPISRIAPPPPSISGRNVVTSKRYLNDLRRKSTESAKALEVFSSLY